MIRLAMRDDLEISLGIEEEFFLVDPETRDLISDPDPAIFGDCEEYCGPHKVVHEFLRSQIETNTKVCATVAELREAVSETRRVVISAAEKHGAAVLASSTHPFAAWAQQKTTPKNRYENFTARFQDVVRRLLVGGMHIHVGFGDPDTRIRVMTAIRRYLPVFHALSTSSPFSGGRETGFKSWRLAIVGSLPRTGIPSPLRSWAEYDRMVANYRRMNFLGDGSELWWDIRPSHSFPTVEMRICDVCPRMEDGVCIAALYASLIRMLVRKEQSGLLPTEPLTEIIAENRWIAQRYGVFAFFGDATQGGQADIDDFMNELIGEIGSDAEALGCEAEVRHALKIVREGAGADRQLDLFRLRRLEGDDTTEALRRVVDLVISETREGI
ncbi:MAG: carboxylate-amine ligase [Albidovulum sp.]|nr:carboxylate-amine ligase [Albidovulum sp.]